MIIGIAALRAGLPEVVKASLTGSILGNLLLVLGMSMLLGGIRRPEQRFSTEVASTYNSLMLLAVIAMIIPAVFAHTGGTATHVQALSLGVAVALLVLYALALLFSLWSHRDVFSPPPDSGDAPTWSVRTALLVLVGSAVLIGYLSELLVGSIHGALGTLGWGELFVGVIVVATVGNAAEHAVAVSAAAKNKMDLAFAIASGSSAQVALFVGPVLVLIGSAIGSPMPLLFRPFELTAMALAVAIVMATSADGRSNWLEGFMLLGVYAMLGLGFYFHP